MTTPTTAAAPTIEAADRIRLHPCRLPARLTWWASVDGRFLREDYPTAEAARVAALAVLAVPDRSHP